MATRATENVQAILAYHEATKHSPDSVGRSRWVMDWSNKPDPFKRFLGLPQSVLERDEATPGRDALDAISAIPVAAAKIDWRTVARLLTWGAGVHHGVRSPDGETIFFRTYASAGALYPVETYLVCRALEGLDAGVYHYDPRGDALELIRKGDHRPSLVRACASEPSIARAPAIVALTGIPWRTAWKYSERGYRHLFWDAGMIVANLLALATSIDAPARVVTGFVDREMDLLLGLDSRRELPVCLLPVGTSQQESVTPASGLPEPLELRAQPLSRTEYEFQAITAANESGRLDSPERAERWRADVVVPGHRDEPTRADGGTDAVEEVLRRRGSARRFGSAPMPVDVLMDVVARATAGVPADYTPGGSHLIEPYAVVNRVDGLERGAYVWREGELRLLREGDFRVDAAFLCLDQRLGGTSAATVFLMADLRATFARMGARGYRAAQLEAGIVAGKMYLGAYAHRFGATGLTFYDDEVERFFEPDAEGKSCMLVVAVGDSPRLRRDRA
jgi:SagB-type dehydrogenase family enzyme